MRYEQIWTSIQHINIYPDNQCESSALIIAIVLSRQKARVQQSIVIPNAQQFAITNNIRAIVVEEFRSE